ncbi:MAG: hypothetical protein LQ338_006605 [Usnochroma carphineum]|nr:MAG: hypothetical protein LQ338_006605 [Usnochroma carphineum]
MLALITLHTPGLPASPTMRALEDRITILRAQSTHVLRPNLIITETSPSVLITAPADPTYHVPTSPAGAPYITTNDEIRRHRRVEQLITARERRARRQKYDSEGRHLNVLRGEKGKGRWRIPRAPTKRDVVVSRIVKRKVREWEAEKRARLMERGGRVEDAIVVGDEDEDGDGVKVIAVRKWEIRVEMEGLEMRVEKEKEAAGRKG